MASHMSELDVKEVKQCMHILDKNNNGYVTKKEWENKKSWKQLSKLFMTFKRDSPEKFTRYSETLWVGPSKSINLRLASVLGISNKAVETFMSEKEKNGLDENLLGEDVQVVRYGKNGHFSCHYDSSDGQYRAYTVMFQLRTVPRKFGGGTWFPFEEDVTTYDCTENQACVSKEDGGTGLVLPCIGGSAIIWMNHRPKEEPSRSVGSPWDAQGRFQPMDWSTLHSGCEVLDGEKWIANQWVFKSSVEKLCNIVVEDEAEEGEQQEL